MVAETIVAFGNAQQKQRYIPRLANGELWPGLLLPVRAGLRHRRREPEGDGGEEGRPLRAQRHKCWITSGDKAGVLLVMAKTDQPPDRSSKGISAFLVEPGMKGFSVGRHEDKMGLRASSTVTINLEEVEVPEENRLGPEGIGFRIAMRALDGGRIGIASQALGIANAALEASQKYAASASSSARPIAEFEAIQWKLADMATELDAAAPARAARRVDEGAGPAVHEARLRHGEGLLVRGREPR
jgi:alkylation response protein AidB-like acyl-CoA dehydrogenase